MASLESFGPIPPPKHKPTLPIPQALGERTGLEQLELVESILKGGKRDWRYVRNRLTSYMLLTAIDPVTGDSVLHRLARTGDVEAMNNISYGWGRDMCQRPTALQDRWVFMVHQNFDGDTALHAAARANSKAGVKGVYRLFYSHELDGVVADDDDDDKYDAQNPPVEYWDWKKMKEEDEELSNLEALDFVCMKNNAGRDAAEEARLAGHEALALWLSGLMDRLDCDGMRGDKEYMLKARQEALEYRWYLGENEEDPVPGVSSLSLVK